MFTLQFLSTLFGKLELKCIAFFLLFILFADCLDIDVPPYTVLG